MVRFYYMDPSAEAVNEAVKFVELLNDVLLFPLIGLMSAVAFLVFLWGCAQYIMNANNDKGRQEGQQHILWGIIGLVVMFSAWGILEVVTATLSLDDELNCANNPTADDCPGKFAVPKE